MMTSGTATRRALLILAFSVLAIGGAAFLRSRPAEALISPTACGGNICDDLSVVGGQTVHYYYTEHIKPSGTFKIRLNAGLYNTNSQIVYIVNFNGAPPPSFSSWDHYKNPAPSNLLMTESSVNFGHTSFELKDSNGCNCIYDQVMTMTFAGLAEGSYTFNLSIIQNGSSGGFLNKTFYVDANAPDTNDESSSLALGVAHPEFDPPCADIASGSPIDNDLDYLGNCADDSCNNKAASGADPTLFCEQPEQTCSDNFDNDADGLKDCLDPDCSAPVPRLGRVSPPAYCQANESLASVNATTPCADGFDNDADGRTDCVDNLSVPAATPSLTCWKQVAYGCPDKETSCTDGVDNDEDKSYDDSVNNWDDDPLTGKDCRDYDCAGPGAPGNGACPANEDKTAVGGDAPEQCFNNVDDDLDHKIDCSDPDCLGVMHPTDTSRVCFEKEFDLAQSYQRCDNNFDDDGDDVVSGDSTDCRDDKVPGGDCRQRFGNCGPCPSREDISYDSCSDGDNNDTDVPKDCADPDCRGSLGLLSNAAHCAEPGGEVGMAMCSDGFDNDADAEIDCADPNCNGVAICSVPDCSRTYFCKSGGEADAISCGDGVDNDADGLADCADSGCYPAPVGLGSCAPKLWANTACQTVPRLSAIKTFTSTDPTVIGQSYVATHVTSTDVVLLTGAASYSSVTIIIGDNTDPLKYYPYAAGLGAGCTLSGTNASNFAVTFTAGHFIQIYNIIQPVNTFNLALTCLTPGTPAAVSTYPISISVLKQPGDVAEYGDVNFSTTLYESVVPSMTSIEGEGEDFGSSTIRVSYGGQRRFRGVPDEPDPAPPGGLDQSGICSCVVNVGGTAYPSVDGECLTDPIAFTSDTTVAVSGFAEDGANNVGANGGGRVVTINVTPTVKTPLSMIAPSKPYFKNGAREIDIQADFQTGLPGYFQPNCDVFLRDSTGTIIGGPVGPTFTFPGVNLGNELHCQRASLDLRANSALPLDDGEYSLSIRATDIDGDSVESNRIAVFVCNSVPSASDPVETVCSKADFDYDGASDALFTTLYSTTPKACDNCIGLANDQKDNNANGVGDACEPSGLHGRCEVDRDIVCDCDSNALSCPPLDLKCPGPSIREISPGVHADPQRCIATWGLCSSGGSICLEVGGVSADEQCHYCDAPGPLTGCSVDQDCEDAGLDPGTTCGVGANKSGRGVCAGNNGITCRRDQDCTDPASTPVPDAYVGPCQGANICLNLLFPWLQTEFGSIFSRKNIIAPAEPPEGQFNATYCVTAQGTIANFKSASCGIFANAGTPFDIPKPPSYTSVFGRIDVPGLLAGKYGPVVTMTQTDFDAAFTANTDLQGKVYVIEGDLAVNDPIVIANALADNKGNGTVIVNGGNLTINEDITYGTTNPPGLNQIASIAWLVLPTINGQTIEKGEIYINKTVHTVVGSFFAGGNEGIYTILPTDTDGPEALEVFGIMVAKKFHLGRSYKNNDKGSERIIFDGRAVANPPPGLGDITKTLPIFSDTPPQQ